MTEPRVEHPWELTEEDEAALDEIWAAVAYAVQDDLAQVVTNEDEEEYRVNPPEEQRPQRRTNDPNRFVWQPGDLEVVKEE